MLAWHSHEHTEDAPVKTDNGLKLDKKHTHCHTDNFFNIPFFPAFTTLVYSAFFTFADTYAASQGYIWQFTFPNNTDLRGPPVA